MKARKRKALTLGRQAGNLHKQLLFGTKIELPHRILYIQFLDIATVFRDVFAVEVENLGAEYLLY